MAHPLITRVPGSDGLTLHAQVWTGDGGHHTPMLLVHGLSSNCRTWDGVAEELSGLGHPVASVDLRGHGLSAKPDGGYDFATMAADLAAALEHLGFERTVVAGQSTGGNLAVELAHRAGERVGAVAGVDGGVIELQRRFPTWAECEAALAPPRFEGTTLASFRGMIRRHHPDWTDAGIEATVANCEVLADGTVRPWLTYEHHLRVLRALWDHRPTQLLPGLSVPVLLLLADSENDAGAGAGAAKRAEAAEAVSASGRVRVEWLRGDHDLHVQHPVPVAHHLHALASDAATAP